jgi:hypothetical protein
MEEIISNFSSPAWWVTAIIAGAIASLTASYAKPILDRFAGSLSRKYRAKVEAKKNDDLRRIEALRVSPNDQIITLLSANHFRLRSIGFLLLGLISITMFTFLARLEVPSTLYFISGAFTLILMTAAFADIIAAQKLRAIVMSSKNNA